MSGTPNGLADVQVHLVDSVEEAQNFLRWIGERRPYNAISVDIETGELPGNPKTDAFSPWHGVIRLVQVGDGQQGWAIPWEEWAGVFYQGIMNYDGPIVCHNLAFEARWFAVKSRWNLPWHQMHDTMLMSQVIQPDSKTHALKKLAGKFVDHKSVALQDTLQGAFDKNGWTWGTVPINYEPYWAYGALDTVLTTRLFTDHFWPQVQPGAMYSTPYELEMQTRKIATRMEVNGARVDLDYTARQHQRLLDYVDEVKERGKNYYKSSLSSPIQLVRLFESMGGEISSFTPSGNKSVDKDQLKRFVRDGTSEIQFLAKLVLDMRKADKLASSYFANFMKDQVDGVIHPSINIMAARTGRMSITNPALQTLPSKDSLVRKAFIPKEDGWGIISSDLDQVEFRLTACFSEDQT